MGGRWALQAEGVQGGALAAQPPACLHSTVRLLCSPTHARHYTIPEDVQVSAPCRDLLSRMLTPDPEARWDMEQARVGWGWWVGGSGAATG